MMEFKTTGVDESRINDLRNALEELRESSVTLQNFDNFLNKVNSIVSSLDVDVRNNLEIASRIMKQVQVIEKDFDKDPEMKDLLAKSGILDWIKGYQDMVELFIRSNSFKSWMITFLDTALDKIASTFKKVRQEIIEIERIKAQKDMQADILKFFQGDGERGGFLQIITETATKGYKEAIDKQWQIIQHILAELKTIKEAQAQNGKEVSAQEQITSKPELELGAEPKQAQPVQEPPKQEYLSMPAQASVPINHQATATTISTKTQEMSDELKNLLKMFEPADKEVLEGEDVVTTISELKEMLGISDRPTNDDEKKGVLMKLSRLENVVFDKKMLCDFLMITPQKLNSWLEELGLKNTLKVV